MATKNKPINKLKAKRSSIESCFSAQLEIMNCLSLLQGARNIKVRAGRKIFLPGKKNPQILLILDKSPHYLPWAKSQNTKRSFSGKWKPLPIALTSFSRIMIFEKIINE
jgi:hypothetical protein